MAVRQRAPAGWIFGLLLAGIIVINMGLIRGSSSFSSYEELAHSRDVLRETVESLERQNEALRHEILKLKQSPSYARKVLRDKYHVTEPDEDIIFFAD